jgi:GAF domain-containing protein
LPGYALIAGSDTDQISVLSGLVSAEGLEPIVARDGREAQAALLARGAPRLMITELSLARADGFALLGGLRRSLPAHEVPAIVLSAIAEFRDTAWKLRDQLGISEVLSTAAPEQAARDALRRVLSGDGAGAGGAASGLQPAAGGRAMRAAEEARLGRIAAMGLVDDLAPDEGLQTLVEETARSFQVPVALVSIVLEDRQWFKAYFGLPEPLTRQRSTPREVSLCRHVVEGDSCQPLVVPDATVHPVLSSNPMVREGFVRGYAGAPLVTPEGTVLGTLCIIDTKPLGIGPDEVETLVRMARRIAGELELRSAARRTAAEVSRMTQDLRAERDRGAAVSSLLLLDAVCAGIGSGVVMMDGERRIFFANQTAADMFGLPLDRLLQMTRDDFVLTLSAKTDRPADLARKMHVLPRGPFSAQEEFSLAEPGPRRIRWSSRPVSLAGGTGQIDLFTDLESEPDSAAPVNADRIPR